MAARTSIGTGATVTLTILSLLTLGLFVTTILFMSQKQAAEQSLQAYQDDMAEIITPGQKNLPEVRQLLSAKKNMTLVSYLIDQQQKIMTKVTGRPTDNFSTLEDQTRSLPYAEGDLMNSTRRLVNDLNAAQSEADRAIEERNAAQEDMERTVSRVRNIESDFATQVQSLQEGVQRQGSSVESYRLALDADRQKMRVDVERIRNETRQEVTRLQDDIAKLTTDNVLLNETITSLQDELKGQRVLPTDEFALVDGQIVGVNASDDVTYISLGSAQKIRLGMTFEVYNDALSIRPGADGEYPAGKATIEVINVDRNTSTCRILSARRGNPIVRGDVVANAIFDPNKVYKFLVYGNFDANRDGFATQQEQLDIRGMIERWGGKLTEELTGDVDFLVLGEKPLLPPPPPADAPLPVVQEYVRLQRIVQKYDELFEKSRATSIPVLNQNRLITLTGLSQTGI